MSLLYTGIKTLTSLLQVGSGFTLEPAYQRVIIDCLNDPDETLRKKVCGLFILWIKGLVSRETVVKVKNAKSLISQLSWLCILVTLRSILSQCFYILYSMFPRFMVYICKTELRQRREIRKSVAPPPNLLRRSTHSYFKQIVAFLKYLLLLLIQNISPFLTG